MLSLSSADIFGILGEILFYRDNMILTQLFAFTRILAELREVKRMTQYTTSDVYENDAEHSYQLAMVCRYIVNYIRFQNNN